MNSKLLQTKFIFLILILTLSLRSNAQDSEGSDHVKLTKNSFNFYFGLHISKSQDLVYSPIIYNGNGLSAINIMYERFNKRGVHSVNIEYDNIETNSTQSITYDEFGTLITRQPSNAIQLAASYGYAVQLKQNKKTRIYLGGVAEIKIHSTEYNFTSSSIDGHIFSNSLHSWFNGTYNLTSKSFITLDAKAPLVSIVARPTYAIVDNKSIQHDGSDIGFFYQTSKLASIGSYQALNLAITFSTQLSRLTSFNFRYRFDYLRFNKPLPISVLKNNFDLGLTFKF
jgi:hypothetical protein